MSTILVIENDAAFFASLEKILKGQLKERCKIAKIMLLKDAERDLRKHGYFDDVELALVDLELGSPQGGGVSDLSGRDTILRLVREYAPWVPVVLMSVYIHQQEALLTDLTTYDFDAVVDKKYFRYHGLNAARWRQFREDVLLNRVAALTGRGTFDVASSFKRGVRLSYGQGVREQLAQLDEKRVEQTISLLDFGAHDVVLDEVVQGFSGLVVVRARVQAAYGGDSTEWLIKIGTQVRKLHEEAAAHRRMFEEGVTRRCSVPLFRWAPVVCFPLAAIAYEFAPDTRTLLSYAREHGAEKALAEVGDALRVLYGGVSSGDIIPREYLRGLTTRKLDSRQWAAGVYGAVVSSVIGGQRASAVDNSARVRIGCQHGDLHTRNILISSRGALLIDFAHYVSRGGSVPGVPLLDAAKLIVDLWIFAEAPWSLREILNADVLVKQAIGSVLCADVPSEDERRFFSAAAACTMARYTMYADVPQEKKDDIVSALSKP